MDFVNEQSPLFGFFSEFMCFNFFLKTGETLSYIIINHRIWDSCIPIIF